MTSRFFLLIFLFLVCLPAPAMAQESTEEPGAVSSVKLRDSATLEEALSKCVKVRKTIERLQCYDSAAEDFDIKEHSDLEKININLDIGKWSVNSEISPIDGLRVIYMSLESEDKVRLASTGKIITPLLVVRCIVDGKNEADLYIVWDEAFSTRDRMYVKHRFGRETPYAGYWRLSHDKKGIFAPEPRVMIRDMLSHDIVRVEATPISTPLDIIGFSLKGFDNVVRSVKDQCGWK